VQYAKTVKNHEKLLPAYIKPLKTIEKSYEPRPGTINMVMSEAESSMLGEVVDT